MASADAYVSLHRAEGYGLTMAEAMMLGKPVIATGYSGNLEFMDEDNSVLVPYSKVRIPMGQSATKSRVTLTVVLPAAIGGIVSGALLAVARAAGETAPLLFTILTVTSKNPNVFSGADTSLPSQIFVNASSPYTGGQARGWARRSRSSPSPLSS